MKSSNKKNTEDRDIKLRQLAIQSRWVLKACTNRYFYFSHFYTAIPTPIHSTMHLTLFLI